MNAVLPVILALLISLPTAFGDEDDARLERLEKALSSALASPIPGVRDGDPRTWTPQLFQDYRPYEIALALEAVLSKNPKLRKRVELGRKKREERARHEDKVTAEDPRILSDKRHTTEKVLADFLAFQKQPTLRDGRLAPHLVDQQTRVIVQQYAVENGKTTQEGSPNFLDSEVRAKDFRTRTFKEEEESPRSFNDPDQFAFETWRKAEIPLIEQAIIKNYRDALLTSIKNGSPVAFVGTDRKANYLVGGLDGVSFHIEKTNALVPSVYVVARYEGRVGTMSAVDPIFRPWLAEGVGIPANYATLDSGHDLRIYPLAQIVHYKVANRKLEETYQALSLADSQDPKVREKLEESLKRLRDQQHKYPQTSLILGAGKLGAQAPIALNDLVWGYEEMSNPLHKREKLAKWNLLAPPFDQKLRGEQMAPGFLKQWIPIILGAYLSTFGGKLAYDEGYFDPAIHKVQELAVDIALKSKSVFNFAKTSWGGFVDWISPERTEELLKDKDHSGLNFDGMNLSDRIKWFSDKPGDMEKLGGPLGFDDPEKAGIADLTPKPAVSVTAVSLINPPPNLHIPELYELEDPGPAETKAIHFRTNVAPKDYRTGTLSEEMVVANAKKEPLSGPHFLVESIRPQDASTGWSFIHLLDNHQVKTVEILDKDRNVLKEGFDYEIRPSKDRQLPLVRILDPKKYPYFWYRSAQVKNADATDTNRLAFFDPAAVLRIVPDMEDAGLLSIAHHLREAAESAIADDSFLMTKDIVAALQKGSRYSQFTGEKPLIGPLSSRWRPFSSRLDNVGNFCAQCSGSRKLLLEVLKAIRGDEDPTLTLDGRTILNNRTTSDSKTFTFVTPGHAVVELGSPATPAKEIADATAQAPDPRRFDPATDPAPQLSHEDLLHRIAEIQKERNQVDHESLLKQLPPLASMTEDQVESRVRNTLRRAGKSNWGFPFHLPDMLWRFQSRAIDPPIRPIEPRPPGPSPDSEAKPVPPAKPVSLAELTRELEEAIQAHKNALKELKLSGVRLPSAQVPHPLWISLNVASQLLKYAQDPSLWPSVQEAFRPAGSQFVPQTPSEVQEKLESLMERFATAPASPREKHGKFHQQLGASILARVVKPVRQCWESLPLLRGNR